MFKWSRFDYDHRDRAMDAGPGSVDAASAIEKLRSPSELPPLSSFYNNETCVATIPA